MVGRISGCPSLPVQSQDTHVGGEGCHLTQPIALWHRSQSDDERFEHRLFNGVLDLELISSVGRCRHQHKCKLAQTNSRESRTLMIDALVVVISRKAPPSASSCPSRLALIQHRNGEFTSSLSQSVLRRTRRRPSHPALGRAARTDPLSSEPA